MIGVVRFEIVERLACGRVIGIDRLDVHIPVDLAKPILYKRHILLHCFKIRRKYDIFAVSVGYVPVKDHI